MEMGKNKSEKFSMDFVMAGMAAIMSKSAAAPIERVKLLLQNQGEMIKRGSLQKPYNGVGDCFKRVLKDEGLFSFWRGNQANVIRYFPTQVMPEFDRLGYLNDMIFLMYLHQLLDFLVFGILRQTEVKGKPLYLLRCSIIHRLSTLHLKAFNFAFKGYFKSIFGRSKEKDGYVMWFAGNVASGSAAGATTSLFLYHLDYARTRLGTDSQRQFKGLLDVYRETLSTDGVVGLYRGFGASIMGITLYRGLYFGIYDTMKPILLVGPLEGNFFASFFLGWSITTVSGVCAYPFDTVRCRMMLTSGQSKKYRSAIHAFCEIVQFRGVFSTIPRRAGVLAGYDQLHRVAHRQGYIFESYQGALK
ncbi:hypothetical protein GOBAR_AA10178 [Gossypium barbadense]|uniref:ADP/ATP translocase n=1 Tax=Gossypium barbadense TaxID=3634 RepID=A0A2P5Y4F1_GOSBA|nr:hypothetical protein GOBAR_AA10178 [Gossypium barbadense]